MLEQDAPPFDPLLMAVFFVYVALLGFVTWHHEPWFDESQAWLIARDSGLVELLTERLRYEGTPGLWHLLLYLPAKLGLPFQTISLISLAIAAATVYLFLRLSPFPWYVKVLVPFGYFTFYQYGVVARSYGLMALLLVSLAAVFGRRNERPILFFLLLAFLANVSSHGFILAGCLSAYHLWHLWLDRSRLKPRLFHLHLLAAAALGLVALVVVIQVWPPKDIGFPAGHVKIGNLCLLLDAFTPHRLLSALVLAVLAIWFWRQKTFLLWAFPILGLLGLFVFKWASVWHEGVLYYHTLLCAWVALERKPPESSANWASRSAAINRCLKLSTVLLLGVHVYWNAVSSYRDVRYPYSGSLEASRYLTQHGLDGEVIHGQGFAAISVLPYFPQNIFDNYNHKQNPSYFLWATGNPLVGRPKAACDDAPMFVLAAVKFPADNGLNCPQYELIRRFEGRIFWKDRILERDSLYLYRLRSEHAATEEHVERQAAGRVVSVSRKHWRPGWRSRGARSCRFFRLFTFQLDFCKMPLTRHFAKAQFQLRKYASPPETRPILFLDGSPLSDHGGFADERPDVPPIGRLHRSIVRRQSKAPVRLEPGGRPRVAGCAGRPVLLRPRLYARRSRGVPPASPCVLRAAACPG